tara:strand:+ start:82 stop:1440 length:1359 start_codon:yes stop_codon:yes gene_type:complete
MNFYKRKQKWGYVLFIIAVVISGLSIYLIDDLSNLQEKSIKSLSQSIETLNQNAVSLEQEEASNMLNFAKAYQTLNNMKLDDEGDYSWASELIQQNKTIPVILLDECHDILNYRNIDMEFNVFICGKLISTPILIEEIKKLNLLEFEEKLSDKIFQNLEVMKKTGDSISIDVWGETQKLYYKNSAILDQTKDMESFTLEKQQEADKILKKMRRYPYYQLGFIFLFAILAYLIFNAAKKSEQNQVWAGMAKETAHQIGTPLSSLMAWVELLKDNPENKNMIVEMNKDLKRLKTITERFSKIGSKAELHEENVAEIIENSISYMERRFSKNIHFIQNISVKSKKVKLNKVLLSWVIENICKNAADAMKGEGEITINCKENEGEIKMYISDTGSGIDKRIINSIFMPGVTSKDRGWGLGLSLSKRIIENYHKGKLFVKSSNKENGTTFCIILPKS